MHESRQNENIDPHVSIIIPTYNHAEFLQEALESVIQQSYKNWETIVIDNHSTDNTVEVVKSFNDSRIKLVEVKNEGVIAVSRNIGVNMAKGQWIAFLDSDDNWYEEKLSIALASEKNSDFIFHDMDILRSDKWNVKRRKITGRALNRPILRDLLVNGNAICNSSVIVRKSLINKIGKISEDSKMKGCEDYNTWLKISQISDRFTYLPQQLGQYRDHENNFSKKNMSNAHMVAISEFKVAISKSDWDRAFSYVQYSKLRYSFLHSQSLVTWSNLLEISVCPSNEIRIKVLYMFLISSARRIISVFRRVQ